MKILLAEDTAELNRSVSFILQYEKYEVDSALDGKEALEYIKTDSYDCIILDIMMPKVDGLTVLREIRNRHILTPVILLTAMSDIEDRVSGLDAGADDYLSKPFSTKELLARIRALIRRTPVNELENLKVEDITLDISKYSLSAKSSVRLSHKEFETMFLIMSNPDVELSTKYLLEHVWRDETNAHEDTVWLYISYLKRKLSLINSVMSIDGEKGGSFKLYKM